MREPTDASKFQPIGTAISTDTTYTHALSLGTLTDDPGQKSVKEKRCWYKKETPDPHIARTELLAQEFFRLIIPHQPETRLALNAATGNYSLLSEAVPGFHRLPSGKKLNFSNGNYKGLGQALLCAVFLQETDLKNGNIGVDNQNRIIKIDGDWCFSEARSHALGLPAHRHPITPEVIAALPYRLDSNTYNWLDLIKMGLAKPDSAIINPSDLSGSPQFRAEINEAMHKICLLPNSVIDKFVDTYLPTGGGTIKHSLKIVVMN